MIHFTIQGNMFITKAQTLVCPVNTVGVMGNGLALAFKQRIPGLFKAYVKACREGVFETVGFFLYDVPGSNRKVLCFPTKRHWAQDSRLEYISQGLESFVAQYAELGIRSIAFPALGCGKGKLQWGDVKPVLEHYLAPLPIQALVFAPG